ncbi:MAG: DUF4956 domain-containing protein [Clostridium sp.]|nr:DUF4956 domain-containing protein [Clostridium sp.]
MNFNDFITSASTGEIADSLTLVSVLEILGSSIIIGLIISLVYLLTHKKEGYSQAFCVALILLAPIVGMVILLIGNNVARAFSLAGAFALIRFRSAPGDPKDIAFVFMSVVMGLACGMGYWLYAGIATLVICAVIIILHVTNYAGKKGDTYTLKITVPETLNYVGAFDETLEKYTKSFKLAKVKSVDFGALFELSFTVELKDNKQIREMLDDLRAMNGNLKIMLSTEAPAVKSFHFQ